MIACKKSSFSKSLGDTFFGEAQHTSGRPSTSNKIFDLCRYYHISFTMTAKRLCEPISGFLTASKVPHGVPLRPALWNQVRRLTTSESQPPAQTLEQTYAETQLSSADTKPILQDTFKQVPSAVKCRTECVLLHWGLCLFWGIMKLLAIA